jgi:formylglycine-generating enzyme required for sulfatase activity
MPSRPDDPGWLHLHLSLDSETSGMTALARGLLVRAVAFFCLACLGSVSLAQSPSERLKKEATEAEKRVSEERDRSLKKKSAVKLEFEALQKPEVRLALAKAVEPLLAKHKAAAAAVKAAKDAGEADAGAKAAALETDVAKDCAAAIRDQARNLAEILDVPLARNLIEAAAKGEDVSAAVIVGGSIGDALGEDSDFEAAWKNTLAAEFEKPLRDAEAAAAAAKSKVEDAERAAKNASSGVPPGMIEVPGGEYEVGDAPDYTQKAMKALGHSADRKLPTPYYGSPKHKVKIAPFYLDQNEVTNRMWAEFCRDTGRAPPAHWVKADDGAAAADGEKKSILPSASPSAPLPAPVAPVAGKSPARGTEDVPVTFITYEAAVAFCNWCGRRLPTEFEWEIAARFPAPGEKERRLYPFGNDFPRDKAPCNYGGAISDPRVRGLPKIKGGHGKDLPMLTPIGSWPESKSALGFNDLSGNAIEMTSSPFVRYPGWALDKIPPGTPINEQFDDASVVMRGGHISANDLMLMASVRRGFPREEEVSSVVGFRTAASKIRGVDLVASLTGNKLFLAKLTDTGPALKDEAKSGRFATLDFENPPPKGTLVAGGFDQATGFPARAKFVAVLNRGSKELTDKVKVASLAKEQKEPLLLGWLRIDVPVVKPALPAGQYWIMWRHEDVKDPTTKKTVTLNELVLRSIDKKEYHVVEGVSQSNASTSSEASHVAVAVGDPKTLEVLLSIPTAATGGKGRYFVQFRLEGAPGAFADFKY